MWMQQLEEVGDATSCLNIRWRSWMREAGIKMMRLDKIMYRDGVEKEGP